jgi:hypothetical protein
VAGGTTGPAMPRVVRSFQSGRGKPHPGLAAAGVPKPSAARSEPKCPATGVDGSAGLEAAADSHLEDAGTAAILLLSLAASSSARSTAVVAAWWHA